MSGISGPDVKSQPIMACVMIMKTRNVNHVAIEQARPVEPKSRMVDASPLSALIAYTFLLSLDCSGRQLRSMAPGKKQRKLSKMQPERDTSITFNTAVTSGFFILV
jgi:hypothetical protein